MVRYVGAPPSPSSVSFHSISLPSPDATPPSMIARKARKEAAKNRKDAVAPEGGSDELQLQLLQILGVPSRPDRGDGAKPKRHSGGESLRSREMGDAPSQFREREVREGRDGQQSSPSLHEEEEAQRTPRQPRSTAPVPAAAPSRPFPSRREGWRDRGQGTPSLNPTRVDGPVRGQEQDQDQDHGVGGFRPLARDTPPHPSFLPRPPPKFRAPMIREAGAHARSPLYQVTGANNGSPPSSFRPNFNFKYKDASQISLRPELKAAQASYSTNDGQKSQSGAGPAPLRASATVFTPSAPPRPELWRPAPARPPIRTVGSLPTVINTSHNSVSPVNLSATNDQNRGPVLVNQFHSSPVRPRFPRVAFGPSPPCGPSSQFVLPGGEKGSREPDIFRGRTTSASTVHVHPSLPRRSQEDMSNATSHPGLERYLTLKSEGGASLVFRVHSAQSHSQLVWTGQEDTSGFFAPARSFASLTLKAYSAAYSHLAQDHRGAWSSGAWMRQTMVDHILCRPSRPFPPGPPFVPLRQAWLPSAVAHAQCQRVGGRGRGDTRRPEGGEEDETSEPSCWISATRSLDWAIFDVARRLAQGQELVRMAVIKYSCTPPPVDSSSLSRQGFSHGGRDEIGGEKVTNGRAPEMTTNPWYQLASMERSIISPLKRQAAMRARIRAAESFEVLIYGRVFGGSIEDDLVWTKYSLPFDLPVKFWRNTFSSFSVSLHGSKGALREGASWLDRLRWDPKVDDWHTAMTKMRERVYPSPKWDDQPVQELSAWPPSPNGPIYTLPLPEPESPTTQRMRQDKPVPVPADADEDDKRGNGKGELNLSEETKRELDMRAQDLLASSFEDLLA